MPSLKNPNQQIPNGYTFLQPETGFKPTPFSSLDSIVTQLIQHRQGQPYLVAKNGWPMDRANVLAEVTAYNVAVCVQLGWHDYLTGVGEASPPFSHLTPRSLREKVAAVREGARTLINWVAEGGEAVAPELANKRAENCAGCPMNKPGGWETWFTVPASNAIRAAMEARKGMNLSTPFDDRLFTCEACLCPIPLKLHLSLERILAKMPPEVQARLHPSCWILKEKANGNQT